MHHLQAITPQKRSASLFPLHEDHLYKEQSPLILTVSSSNFGKVKLQMLQSPLPTTKDLFSQLIASGQKVQQEDYFKNYEIMEEDSFDNIDILDLQKEISEHEESEDCEMSEDYDEENDIKKRKRKSGAQLKLLKNQFEKESNWSKDKIAEMSEITGLSQSQVYKWWWDQKKKTSKHERELLSRNAGKRKFIKKEAPKRLSSSDSTENAEEEEGQMHEAFTKLKKESRFQQFCQTEKKINKRLTFF